METNPFGKALQELRQEYEQKYGFVVFDLAVRETAHRIEVRGEVLTAGQAAAALERLGANSTRTIASRIKVLSDPRTRPLGWAKVKAPLAELKTRPLAQELQTAEILGRLRATQAGRGEILRVLAVRDEQLLVQAKDLALGWINRTDVTMKKSDMRAVWRVGKPAASDKLVSVKVPKAEAIRAAEKYLGTPYVLGAKSFAGIDCSGLTQLAYEAAFGVILPRHSWDQKKVGRSLGLGEAEAGDLAFMVNLRSNAKHVGLLDIKPEGNFLLHASGVQGKVVRQRAEEVFERYELVEVRRIIKR